MKRLLVLLCLLGHPIWGEEIVAGLSQNRVSITANFDGSEILIFGAVKRDAPAPESQMDVIITVAGPNQSVLVRRKARHFGIWVNSDSVSVDKAPSFYAVATSGPLEKVLTETEDLRNEITATRAIRSVGAEVADSGSFTEALIRLRSNADQYQFLPSSVDVKQETLFNTSIALPANLTEGDYVTRIFLTRNGKVVGQYQTKIGVHKDGLERWMFDLAHRQPTIYGLLSLAMAIFVGWVASAIFRFARG
jgi:uncharacterized protein (TIGR02186 family)